MSEITQNFGGWLASVVIGSGGTLAVAWWALRGRLAEIFQTRESAEADRKSMAADMAGLRKHADEEFAKVDRTMEGLDRRVQSNASTVALEKARLDVLTERVSGQTNRLEEMHTAVQRLEGKLDSVSATTATMAEAIKGLTASMDHLRSDLKGRG